MAKYCPICFGEFKDIIKICPKDNVDLTNKKPADIDRLVDIYAASNEIEAERIMTFLQDKDIIARESPSGISQVPVASDTRFVIAVFKEDVKLAKDLIKQARVDGVISNNGNFM